jgi:hypothetical protein
MRKSRVPTEGRDLSSKMIPGPESFLRPLVDQFPDTDRLSTPFQKIGEFARKKSISRKHRYNFEKLLAFERGINKTF